MILLSNIIKDTRFSDNIIEFNFNQSFEDKNSDKNKKKGVDDASLSQQAIFEDEAADVYQQTSEILEKAQKRAKEITDKAQEEAEQVLANAKQAGHEEGYDAGFKEGYEKAYEEHKKESDRQLQEHKAILKQTIESVAEEKEKILEKYIDDLKRITLTIAEKVIQTSLKSSGEVIKRMIVAAAGKLKRTQWIKIYVSQNDAGQMIQGDVGLLNELSHISGNIKIIAMDHAEEGTCIIELPEEIIDVSVNTQLENIKGILNNARL